MSEDNCPICREESIMTCRCFKSDSRCKNGHEWHYCLAHKGENRVVLGHSDHSKDTMACSCKVEKAVRGEYLEETILDGLTFKKDEIR